MTDLVDVLKLEVGADPAGDLVNRAPNPGGADYADFGGWGWVAENGTTATGDATGITFTTTAAGTQRLRTNWIDLAAVLTSADSIAASWRVVSALPAGLYYRARLVYRSVDPVPTPPPGTQTGYLSAAATVDLDPEDIPWGPDNQPTIQVALAFDFYGTIGGAAPAADLEATFDQVTVAVAADAGDLDPLGYLPTFDWTDILGPTHEIKITRAPLDANTLSARVIDTSLDPAVADTLRFGRPVRVRTLNDATAAWEHLFAGRIEFATADYDLTRPADEQVTITLTAYDADAVFARIPQPNSAPHLHIIGAMLLDAGVTNVPWNVDGSGAVADPVDDVGDPFPALTLAPTNPGAKLIDQLAFLRETNLGYVWVDKAGVLRAESDRTGDFYDGTAVLDETAYSDLSVGFDPAQIINVITFEIYTTSATGEPVIETRGPIRDEASIAEWDEHPATFKVIGPIIEPRDSDIGGDVGGSPLLAIVDEVFAANDDVGVTVSAVTLPIRSPADITRDRALIDLYALAQVTNTDRGLDQTGRVLAIEHAIIATIDHWHWLTTLGFAGESRPADPGAGSSAAGAVVGIGGVGAPPAFENTDTETYDGTGDLVLYLSHVPIRKSLQIKHNGLELEPTEWSLVNNVVTVDDADVIMLEDDVFTAWYCYAVGGGTGSAPVITPVWRATAEENLNGFLDPTLIAELGDLLVAVAMVPSSETITSNGWDFVGASSYVTHSAIGFGTRTYCLEVYSTVNDGSGDVPIVSTVSAEDVVCSMSAFEDGAAVTALFDTLDDGTEADAPALDPVSLRVWGAIGDFVTIIPDRGTSVLITDYPEIDITMTVDDDPTAATASTGASTGWCLASLAVTS